MDDKQAASYRHRHAAYDVWCKSVALKTCDRQRTSGFSELAYEVSVGEFVKRMREFGAVQKPPTRTQLSSIVSTQRPRHDC